MQDRRIRRSTCWADMGFKHHRVYKRKVVQSAVVPEELASSSLVLRRGGVGEWIKPYCIGVMCVDRPRSLPLC